MDPPKVINVKFEQKEFKLDISDCNNVGNVKERLSKFTGLTSAEHSLMNLLIGGKPAQDVCPLPDLYLKPNFTLVVEKINLDDAPSTSRASGVRIPRDWSGFQLIEASRHGKPLLVLDLDDTLLDCRVPPYLLATRGSRPHLQDFLTRIYVHYDICIWSAVPMQVLKNKIAALQMNKPQTYKIAFYVDCYVMSPAIISNARSTMVKSLQEIWARFPAYTKANTMLCDDHQKNVNHNKTNALLVRPYHYGLAASDNELLKVEQYLLFLIESCPNFSLLDHSTWRSHKSVTL